MSRPPRNPRSHLLSVGLVSWSLLQGVVALGAVTALLLLAFRQGMAPDEMRALGFVMLVGLNLVLIFVNRTFTASLFWAFVRPNRLLTAGLGIVAVLLTLIFGWPPARAFFELGPLHVDDLAACATALALTLLVLQLARGGWRGRLEK